MIKILIGEPTSAKTITSDREDPLVSQIRHFADVIHGTDTHWFQGAGLHAPVGY